VLATWASPPTEAGTVHTRPIVSGWKRTSDVAVALLAPSRARIALSLLRCARAEACRT